MFSYEVQILKQVVATPLKISWLNCLSAGFYGEGNFNMKVTVRINLDIAKIIYALTFLIIAMS